MASDISDGLKDVGGAVSDLFASKGATASAGSYLEAAAIAQQNAQIERQSTSIKQYQNDRQIYKVLGMQSAQIGKAGFAQSGTALDLMRSSATEGAILKATTAEQGAITENSYAEQAGLYSGMASAAKASGTAAKIGGVLQGAGGALSLYNAIGGGGSAVADGGAILDAGVTAVGDVAAASEGVDLIASLGELAVFL